MTHVSRVSLLVLLFFIAYIQNGYCCCKAKFRVSGIRVEGKLGCYGCGRCNIFCCDCIGGCCPNQRYRRDLADYFTNKVDTIEDSLQYFQSVDANQDRVISPFEFIEYVISHNMTQNNHDKNELTSYFNQMDKNGDGYIQPVEFEHKLADI
ncbi:unnamed protein product [Rotaria sp. Silwood1]|nr:unnamed protein product [Rotaria sp. Silwood1]CAF3722008.1 unnamed protein product [Rotaria sp. Silwood1]